MPLYLGLHLEPELLRAKEMELLKLLPLLLVLWDRLNKRMKQPPLPVLYLCYKNKLLCLRVKLKLSKWLLLLPSLLLQVVDQQPLVLFLMLVGKALPPGQLDQLGQLEKWSRIN